MSLIRLLLWKLFSLSKTFFDKSKAQLQAISKLALRSQTVEIAALSLRQDLLTKNVLMTDKKSPQQ